MSIQRTFRKAWLKAEKKVWDSKMCFLLYGVALLKIIFCYSTQGCLIVFCMISYILYVLQIYNITFRVPLSLNSSAWSEMLGYFGKMAKSFIENAVRKRFVSDNSIGIKATKDCLETSRYIWCFVFFIIG